jgi:hypothetical protein
MTDLRDAARQALEALEDLLVWHSKNSRAITAITALKAALEQQKPPPEAQAEAEKIAYCAGWWAAMEQLAVQPLQEPVAYLYHDAQSAHDANPMLHSTLLVMATERRPEYRNETPLYTLPTPPRREPEQEPIPFSGADEKPPVFGRRWRIAKDGFGLQLDNDGPYVEINDALSVLHAALEQQAKPDVEYYGLEPWEVPQHIPFATAIYPAHSPDKPFLALGDCAHLYRDAAKCVPLFTHPPRREWRSLSEEEIQSVIQLEREKRFQRRPPLPLSMTELSHAIEAKLKEKNHE